MGVRERGGGAVMSAVLVIERARGVTRDRERRAERRDWRAFRATKRASKRCARDERCVLRSLVL